MTTGITVLWPYTPERQSPLQLFPVQLFLRNYIYEKKKRSLNTVCFTFHEMILHYNVNNSNLHKQNIKRLFLSNKAIISLIVYAFLYSSSYMATDLPVRRVFHLISLLPSLLVPRYVSVWIILLYTIAMYSVSGRKWVSAILYTASSVCSSFWKNTAGGNGGIR